MKINISSLLLLLTFSVSGTFHSMSQNLHENVNVEGIFKPEVIRQERINVLPHSQNFPIERQSLKFDNEGIAAAFAPSALAIPVSGWNTTRPEAPRGYVDVSLGSWLNSNLSAGYSIIRKPQTDFAVSFQHNSTSLWNPYKGNIEDAGKRFRYDESIAARFSHSFTPKSVINASFDYHLGYFNYFFVQSSPLLKFDEVWTKVPTQTLNDLSLRVGWNASRGNQSWYAGGGLRYFGFRELYFPSAEMRTCEGERETHLGFDGGWRYKWEKGSSLGIDGKADLLFYGKHQHQSSPLFPLNPTENYGQISLNPYYSFTREKLLVTIGARVDLTFNAQGDKEDSHYSLFHIAPDIRFDWKKNDWGLYLHLTGGSQLNTLAFRHELNYYNMPAVNSTQPIYTPLDSRLGVEFGPRNRFNAGFSIAFRASKHVRFDGWYPTLLTYGYQVAPGLSGNPGSFSYDTNPQGYDLHGVSFDLHASWSPLNNLVFKGDVSYQPQHGKRGYFNGIDRPRWILALEGEYKPVKSLSISLGYDYRGVRTIYTTHDMGYVKNIIIGGVQRVEIVGLRLPDITSLNAGVKYDINTVMSVGIKGYNLLNRRNLILPSLPGEGIDLQGTFTWRF